ncbi:concanavalin A-like lectin/glucanase family protein, partial [Toxoplasma gondii VEG]
LLFKGIFCVTDDVIPDAPYKFLAADISLPCSSAGTFTICGAAGLFLWLVLLPAGHFFFMSRRLGDDIWLTDRYSLFCSWPVYGFRSGYRLTYGLQIVAVNLVLAVTSLPLSHGRLVRTYEAPGGIEFSFSFVKLVTSSQIIIAINIIGVYLVFLFIAHPFEPAKFVLTSHLAVFSCVSAISLYVYTYYQNIAPGTDIAIGIGIVALLLQIIFFVCAGVCALVESGLVKQTRNRIPFVDKLLAAASNKIKSTAKYRALYGEEEEQDLKERWEALRMDRASKEAQQNQQARHARLGMDGKVDEEVVVERAAILRLSSKTDQVALLEAVTSCKSVPRALAAFERLTFFETFPTMERLEARAALEKLAFDGDELDSGLKLFLKHRNAMMRIFSRFSVANLNEGFACGWELGLLRYIELDDAKLELANTKEKADNLLKKARQDDLAHMGRKGAGLYREDVHEWNVLKAEACRITLQCLLLDLSDYHFHIPRQLPRRRFLATGTAQDAEDIQARRDAVEDEAYLPQTAVAEADLRALVRLGSGEDEAGGFGAGVQLYEFAAAEPKRLQRKRLLERTYALYQDFKLIFPNALPCIERAPDAGKKGEVARGSVREKQDQTDPMRHLRIFRLDVLGHHIAAEDGRSVYFRGNFRSVVGPSGDLTGLDLSQNPRSAIVVDPPVALHARYTIECWILLPLLPSASSASNVGIYRALCADSDGDMICCFRQGPSRTRTRRESDTPGEYRDANWEKKAASARRQLHFGLFLFPETEDDASISSDAVASNCGSDVEAGDPVGGPLGFFEGKLHAADSEKNGAFKPEQLQSGWHHLLVSHGESGTSYFWDGECVGLISALSLPFAGFCDLEAIGNTRDGGHVFGAFSDFAVFATQLDDEAAKVRFAYLQRHLVNTAVVGQAVPAPMEPKEPRRGAAGRRRSGIGTDAPGALDLDLLVEVSFIPASSSRKKWALCAVSPDQMRAITYRRESSQEAKAAGASDAAFKRCDASGKGGVGLVGTGPEPRGSPERAYGGSTANGSCVVLDPAVEVARELVPIRAWTVFAWICVPLPQTTQAHVLVAGKENFHVCVLSDQRSVGVMYFRGRRRGRAESNGDSEESDADSVDSDGCLRDEYPSGFDIRDLEKGWHQLCVVATDAGQAFYADGTMRGYLPKSTWEPIRFLGNAATGNKPWGTFADVSIYGRFFGAADVESEFAKYRVGFRDPFDTRAFSRGGGSEGLSPGSSSPGGDTVAPAQPDERRSYEGHMCLQVCSDGANVVLRPSAAAETHEIRVFHIDGFAKGVSGKPVAFDCVKSLAVQRQRRQAESGGGIRVHPAVSCKRAWTIIGWIQTPIPVTGMMHALVGGKDGEVPVVVDRDCETLGVCTAALSQDARGVELPSAAGYLPFIRSTATLKNLSAGWHQLAVSREKKCQYFYLDGVYAGFAPSTCDSSVTCFGNARSADGKFEMPFGCFNTVCVYTDAMTPSVVASTYSEHLRLIKSNKFDLVGSDT